MTPTQQKAQLHTGTQVRKAKRMTRLRLLGLRQGLVNIQVLVAEKYTSGLEYCFVNTKSD